MRKIDKKKRKKLLILLLILVLFFPITYRYKDGGLFLIRPFCIPALSTIGWKRMSPILQLGSFLAFPFNFLN